MKLNFVQTLISIIISVLIAYGLYSFYSDANNKDLLSLGSFIFLSMTLGTTIGVDFNNTRNSVNLKIISAIFFFIALSSNVIFFFTHFKPPVYIIINGLLMLIFIFSIYSLNRTRSNS